MSHSTDGLELNSTDSRRNVVITGFGIFRDHELNASWEAIRNGRLKIDRPNVNIVTRQIDVSYDQVNQVVPALWGEFEPLLMVHVGLAAHQNSIRIEQVARHGPFIHDDVCKSAPHKDLRVYYADNNCLEENLIRREYSCKPCTFPASNTCFDVTKVCNSMRRLQSEGRVALRTSISDDAGLYVCEYIYQQSLRICDRAIFIHVPDTANFELVDISVALSYLIELLIDEAIAIVEKSPSPSRMGQDSKKRLDS